MARTPLPRHGLRLKRVGGGDVLTVDLLIPLAAVIPRVVKASATQELLFLVLGLGCPYVYILI